MARNPHNMVEMLMSHQNMLGFKHSFGQCIVSFIIKDPRIRIGLHAQRGLPVNGAANDDLA